MEDDCVIPGAGAFEIAVHRHLMDKCKKEISGKVKLGVICFADAMLVIPRTLADNSGLDAQDVLLKV